MGLEFEQGKEDILIGGEPGMRNRGLNKEEVIHLKEAWNVGPKKGTVRRASMWGRGSSHMGD